MRIGVLGTGVVGRTLATKLVELGHEVRIGSARRGCRRCRRSASAASRARCRAGSLLESFGWPRGRVVDLGGIEASRAVEMYLPLWLRLFQTFGTPDLNVRVAR
jgi:predicted dinucleotide-binding enzyme